MEGKPIKVGITQGDPNGIGYEIIFKAVAEEGITDLFTPVIFGIPEIAEKAKQKFSFQNIKLHVVKNASEIKDGKINLVDIDSNFSDITPGAISKESGETAVKALEEAVKALKSGKIDLLVTAPISKEACQSESFNFPGHTEFLTDRLGNGEEEALMILCNNNLRVALLTKHIPISQIPENITKEKIEDHVEKFSQSLKMDFGIIRPTIAVLSLNPHAGDGGVIGQEEETIIKPAIEELQQKGVLAFGPFPADGFFGHESYKKFDGIMAMYHDQGLAPFKTLATSGGVNFSAGLPYVRTSPDHGTALDIAWEGKADAKSMREAIYMAIDVWRRRKTFMEARTNPLKKFVHDKPEKNDKSEKN